MAFAVPVAVAGQEFPVDRHELRGADVGRRIAAALVVDMRQRERAVRLRDGVQQRPGLGVERDVPVFRKGFGGECALDVGGGRMFDERVVDVEFHDASLGQTFNRAEAAAPSAVAGSARAATGAALDPRLN